MKKALLILATAILLTSCTAVNHHLPTNNPAGLWIGIWHGIISPITLIISIFNDKVSVWDTNNNGFLYVAGFLIGAGSLTGWSAKASK
ncbi:MAG: hypothetical protein ABIN91_11150 [Mucilaginibacter sp.]|uniref:hypothetical protein n=1 Tax=Mucilaginibacter sp. TaxID=1882438 RepID=UPI0032670943